MYQKSHPSRVCRRGGMFLGLLVCLVVLCILGGVGYQYYTELNSRAEIRDLITDVVVSGSFDHIVLEQGEIESSSNTEVICEVQSNNGGSGTAILWVVDEGTRVKKGDKLVELDTAQLEIRLKEQKIEVITEEARVTTANALLEQATIAKREYLEGVFVTEESLLESELAIAGQNLTKARLAILSSERLVAKGLIKELQIEADQFAVLNARTQQKSVEARLGVLRDLTKKKMLVQFDSEIEAAKAALSAASSELMEEQNELDDVLTQIEKCVLYSPADGVVVHANRFSNRGGGAEFVVEAGATVRERQAIIRLPDPTRMQVKCNVNESRITLIQDGMPAKISIDAIPGMKLTGKVKKVNRYAEPGGFFGSSIKEYATTVEIIDPPENIRTGMTAEVQIFVEQLADAKQIPIQGLYEHGGQMYSLVQQGPQSFKTVPVTLGATNDTMASISEGLELGDKLVLNLREHLTLMDLPEIVTEDNSEMRALGAERSKALAATNASLSGDESGVEEAPRGGNRRGGGGPGRPDGLADGGSRGGPGGDGGGAQDAGTMVSRTMERSDADGDGTLSAEEISTIDERWRSGITAADEDGDGQVTRAELLKSMNKRFSSGGDSGGAQ